MSQPDAEPTPPSEEGEEIAPTPFDNPFFLPVILVGFAIWFTYDGWFNPNMEWLKFNRVGAVITAILGSYYTWRALRERRAGQGSGDREPQA